MNNLLTKYSDTSQHVRVVSTDFELIKSRKRNIIKLWNTDGPANWVGRRYTSHHLLMKVVGNGQNKRFNWKTKPHIAIKKGSDNNHFLQFMKSIKQYISGLFYLLDNRIHRFHQCNQVCRHISNISGYTLHFYMWNRRKYRLKQAEKISVIGKK